MVRAVPAQGAGAVVPFMIRWGALVSSGKLRHCARCSSCGAKGATIQIQAGAEQRWVSTVSG
jgi:hypothetical protein